MLGKGNDVTLINTLTTTLIDSINGYREAAANSKTGRFQQLFREMADERSRVAEDLRVEIRRLGETHPTPGRWQARLTSAGSISRPRSPAATTRRRSTRSNVARIISRASSRLPFRPTTCRWKAAR